MERFFELLQGAIVSSMFEVDPAYPESRARKADLATGILGGITALAVMSLCRVEIALAVGEDACPVVEPKPVIRLHGILQQMVEVFAPFAEEAPDMPKRRKRDCQPSGGLII